MRAAPTERRRTYVALLRGINVGGKNRLPMKDLVEVFTALGCTEVRTYIQSGNVVFRAPDAVARQIAPRAPDAIAQRFGLRVAIVLRTAEQMRAVARNNPFLRTGADPRTLHVAFLASKPTPARAAALDPARSAPDEFAVRGGEIYLRLADGMARTKLTNDYFDTKLETTSTVRNWATVVKLREWVGGD